MTSRQPINKGNRVVALSDGDFKTGRSKGQSTSLPAPCDLHPFNAQLQSTCAAVKNPAWICFNPAASSISDRGFLLRKLAAFVATMGLIAVMAAGQPHYVMAANRSGLWVVVHDICVPAYQSIGVAFPCLEVNLTNGLDRGFAVLQTPSSTAHVIVVPTTRISGIESPALQSEDAPNYWEAAWDARRFVEQEARRRLPRERIGMAINSTASRSQDQLHIHVSCIAPAVADFLRRHQTEIRGAWSPLRAKLAGHKFSAMKVETESLARVDPFKLLMRGVPSNELSIGRQTLAVIGATFRNGKSGFYLLANDARAAPRDTVGAEALLDDKCAN